MTHTENPQATAGTPPHETVALGDYRLSLEGDRLVVRTVSGSTASVLVPGRFNRDSIMVTLLDNGVEFRVRR